MAKKKNSEPTTATETPSPVPLPAEVPLTKRVLSRYTEKLPVKLTTEELYAAGKRVASLCLAIADHTERAKARKAELDAEKARLEEERSDVCRLLRDETEPRQVECIAEADYKENLVRTIRMDTCETVATRKLEVNEAQKELFESEKEENPKGPPACAFPGCAAEVKESHLCETCGSWICDLHAPLAVDATGHEPSAHWAAPEDPRK